MNPGGILDLMLDSSVAFAWGLAWKAGVLLSVILLFFHFARRFPPSLRHILLAFGFATILLLPAFEILAPRVEWHVLPAEVKTSPGFEVRETQSLGLFFSVVAEAGPGGRKEPLQKRSIWGALLELKRILLFCWIIVGGFFLIRGLQGVRRARQLVKSAVPPGGSEWNRDLEELVSRLSIDRPVRLLISSQNCVPMVIGSRRPVILMPALSRNWNRMRRRIVLLHELGHVKRNDLFVLSLVNVVCGLHWYNPLVWIGRKLIRAEGEKACDLLVMSCGWRASDYAWHLLQLSRTLRNSQRLEGVVAMFKESQIEQRIRAILAIPAFSFRRSWAGLIGFILVTSSIAATLSSLSLLPTRAAGGEAVVQSEAAEAPPSAKGSSSQAPQPLPRLSNSAREAAAPPGPPAPPEPPTVPAPPAPPEPPTVPAPPPPPSPPAPAVLPTPAPLPTIAAGEEGEDNGVLKWRNGEDDLTIQVKGIKLSSDFRSVRSIEPGGYLIVARKSPGREDRVEVRPGPGGDVEKSYWVNGIGQSWSQDSEELLQKGLAGIQEISFAREELEHLRETELARVREELSRLKEEDLLQAKEALERAREEIEQQKELLELELNEEELQRLKDELKRNAELLQQFKEEDFEKLNRELMKLREEMPDQIMRELEKARESLEQMMEALKEVEVEDA